VTPATLNQLFFGAAARYASRPAVMRRKIDGRWQDLPFDQLLARVHHLAVGLRELGLQPGDRMAILSENRPEWAVVDYACLATRLIDVPIYPTLTTEQTGYILRDAEARGIFVSSAAHLARIASMREQLPALEFVILFDGDAGDGQVIVLGELERRGEAAAARYPDWARDALAVAPHDLATLIYTSGTTGEPKGVMLSHGNITSNVVAALSILPMSPADECLSFLPLCHIFERMVGHYTMLQAGAVINYASSVEAVVRELPEVRPTVVASVPRIYEKIYDGVLAKLAEGSDLSRSIFAWALRAGEARLDYQLRKQPVPALTALRGRMADALVFNKLRRRTGGRIRFFVSGGAPLNPEIARFFLSAGIMLFEGYGLTETSPVISANTFDALKLGTVGKPMPGVEVRIADDGEILTRGPHVMQGYFHKPDATREATDPDGWFRTGDIGELDQDGFLKITDRKKDLIKTSGGKYVAPQPIEGMVRVNRFIANAVLLGDRRKYPVMLLIPDFDAVRGWMAAEQMPPGEPEDVVQRPAVREKIEREARGMLRGLAQFESPKKFLILPREFTIASGELTPSLKVKRRVVETNYHDQIEALYAGL
jgi:long-chain acyl-CoA synthetase